MGAVSTDFQARARRWHRWLSGLLGGCLGFIVSLGWFSGSRVAEGYVPLPLTQTTHGVGRIDHDFMELSATLLVLLLSLHWLARPERVTAGVALGLSLGLANGVNISLFILQLPVLMIALLRCPAAVRY